TGVGHGLGSSTGSSEWAVRLELCDREILRENGVALIHVAFCSFRARTAGKALSLCTGPDFPDHIILYRVKRKYRGISLGKGFGNTQILLTTFRPVRILPSPSLFDCPLQLSNRE